MNITQYKLQDSQYSQEEFTKTQIFIHHTAGGANSKFVIDGWNSTTDRVATSYIISGLSNNDTSVKDGEVFECFPDKYFAYHLGLKSDIFSKYKLPFKPLDKTSVGIELCNWGYLTKQGDGTFKNYVGGTVPLNQVIKLNSEYKGHEYYHAYSDAQLMSLRELLNELCDKYAISKKFNEGMFFINQACLNGSNGIWTHTSVREDKQDCPPQPKLISMLQTLEQNTL